MTRPRALFALLAAAFAAAVVAERPARADGCWDSFAPDLRENTAVRRLSKKDARDILVYLHGQGELVLNDVSGRELNDTSEGKPIYANNAHDQIFKDDCTVKWPGETDRFYLNQTIAGVEFRYSATGRKKSLKPQKYPLNNLDARHAVGLYRLARHLGSDDRGDLKAAQIYHVGVGRGAGESGDCHNSGRALDFVGVRTTAGVVYTVWDDWDDQTDANDGKPALYTSYTRLAYRLDGKDTDAETLFRTVYELARANYNDRAGAASQIGEGSEILHPDTPSWGSCPGGGTQCLCPGPGVNAPRDGRKCHGGHVHMDISR